MPPPQSGGTWILDLDGVVWLSDQPIAGSARAVERLRQAGRPVLFATNNADPTIDQLLGRLGRAGIPATVDEIVTSGQASAALLQPGDRALACGGEGLVEALTARGVDVVDRGPADAVVVGMTRAFDYDLLTTAALAVRAGARLIGTNEDPTHPTPAGLFPGSGALIAAVATAAETPAVMAGKPHPPMAALLQARAPVIEWVVGDRPATDGRLARRLGAPFALVLSGVIAADHGPLDVDPDEESPDLGELVSRWIDH